ncbi:MAG: IS66 family transposase [Actinomycetota bacterium]
MQRPRIDLKLDELPGLLERAKQVLSPEDHATLKAITETLTFVAQELLSKTTTIERLRYLLFESKTEKTSSVLGDRAAGGDAERKRGAKEKPPGHGRNGAAAYTGATKVKVAHPSLHEGDACPGCEKGHVYLLPEPATAVRITGVAPLGAKVYQKDRWRCNLCGEVFTAPSPEGVGEEKYDENATSMVGLLKYGTGLPFNRIEKLQAGMGIPLPAATQWELVRDGAKLLAPAHQELIRQAADGEVLHNDDTAMKVLELTAEQRAAAIGDQEADERTGIFTSGIVATACGHRIALFFTGAKHAGENLSEVLARREAELPPPIQMCDALSANTAGELDTILANCMAHGRRRFVGVADNFPAECRHVLETLRGVYRNDAFAKKTKMSAAERLHFHQTQSGPLMTDLETWMKSQLAEHKVEPNSGLGEAIGYMLKHWSELTLFLREPGAPLDNNICERALKKAILHRKNALFYKTLNGAHVGDVFMSLIHSAELNGAKPFDYLVALLRHHQQVEDAPAEWMPWNYLTALDRTREDRGPPVTP